MQRRRDDGEAGGVGAAAERRVEVLLSRAGVGLEAGVPQLHDVARARVDPLAARQVPVDEVPAAGPELEVDRGGVEDHRVAGRDRADEPGQDVGAARRAVDLDIDLLQAGPLVAERDDDTGSERGHPANLPVGDADEGQDFASASIALVSAFICFSSTLRARCIAASTFAPTSATPTTTNPASPSSSVSPNSLRS